MNPLINRLAKIHDLRVSTILDGSIIAVEFENGYIKDGCVLIGAYGRGKTIDEAAENYYQQIAGKEIVIDKTPRKTFYVV